jgi:hypothetical protein
MTELLSARQLQEQSQYRKREDAIAKANGKPALYFVLDRPVMIYDFPGDVPQPTVRLRAVPDQQMQNPNGRIGEMQSPMVAEFDYSGWHCLLLPEGIDPVMPVRREGMTDEWYEKLRTHSYELALKARVEADELRKLVLFHVNVSKNITVVFDPSNFLNVDLQIDPAESELVNEVKATRLAHDLDRAKKPSKVNKKETVLT